MTNAQVTHIQIDNYGPWTVTPEPRREVDLQTLQSRLFADLSQLFGNRDGYVFFARFDNMIAITNGIGMADHERIQESVRNRYPVTMSLGLAADRSPVAALGTATEHLQDAGSAQDRSRREILEGRPVAEAARTDEDVQIAHFEFGGADEGRSEFDTFVRIEQGYTTLMRHMRRTHESLSFFVGGNDAIAVCPALDAADVRDAVAHVTGRTDLDLRVGVGRGVSAAEAGMAAKRALERCRRDGRTVTTSF